MDMCQKREMRKNKRMNEDEKSLLSTNINWLKGILGNSVTNPYKTSNL